MKDSSAPLLSAPRIRAGIRAMQKSSKNSHLGLKIWVLALK
ncbi:hypothetical protein VEx25_2108 [Vibrio antiquarius]|uniref:Uncharacterized protein n=1 Tax=Vibrio antiquarius (strain Ex25) TaxID=150340 RepID=A0ABM9WT86_VIBAE|nr:hypothetical protein VEx25_2108 [Vibrio antiquarius]